MNIVCAVLFQHLDEEEAFWVLVCVVRGAPVATRRLHCLPCRLTRPLRRPPDLLPDYYTPSMVCGVVVWATIPPCRAKAAAHRIPHRSWASGSTPASLRPWCRSTSPKFQWCGHAGQPPPQQRLRASHRRRPQHLTGLGASVPLISFQWFLCLFAGVTHPEVTARAWDNIFLHGVPFLHRLGLALLHEARSAVLGQSDIADVVVAIRSVAESLDGGPLLQVRRGVLS